MVPLHILVGEPLTKHGFSSFPGAGITYEKSPQQRFSAQSLLVMSQYLAGSELTLQNECHAFWVACRRLAMFLDVLAALSVHFRKLPDEIPLCL